MLGFLSVGAPASKLLGCSLPTCKRGRKSIDLVCHKPCTLTWLPFNPSLLMLCAGSGDTVLAGHAETAVLAWAGLGMKLQRPFQISDARHGFAPFLFGACFQSLTSVVACFPINMLL